MTRRTWAIIGGTVALVLLGVAIGLQAKGKPRSPRSRRLIERRSFGLLVILCGMVAMSSALHRDLRGAVVWGVCAIALAPGAAKRTTDNDEREDYAFDPAHCGRCARDLTGNTTGVCPECGWAIPASPVVYERGDWTIWWSRWHIDHLENWKKSLVRCACNAVVFTGLGIWSAGRAGAPVPAALGFVIGAHWLVNAVRVIAYARRAQRVLPPPRGPGQSGGAR